MVSSTGYNPKENNFKASDIGLIPFNWKCENIGSILKIKHGKSQHHVVDVNGKYPILATGGEIGKANTFIYDKPSVLIGRKGTIDVPQYTEKPFWSIDTLFYSEIFSQKALPKYIFYKFNTINWYLYNEASGVPSLNAKTIENILIPLPPLPEQIAIAAALSDVDALISALDTLITKKRDIKQGTMQELLTGKRRLPGFSGKWQRTTIENIAAVTTGNKDTQDRVENGQYPFFVRSQIVERINSYSYDGEAVLTAGDGVGVGKVFHHIVGKFDFHQRVYMIHNFKDYDGHFFFMYFSTFFFKEATKYNAKNSVDSIRREMVTGMTIPVPALKEQKAIAQIISNMNIEIEKLEKQKNKFNLLKQGMMQELLTGKTRLI